MFYNTNDRWVKLVLDTKYEDSAIALREYLQLVDHSESPREYHLWSFISLVSASLRRRCWASLGNVGLVLPNQFIVLVGPPATRKSSALSMAQKFHWAANVRLGPGDTSGQRHGLMVAFQGSYRTQSPKRVSGLMAVPKSLDDLAATDTDEIDQALESDNRNHDLYLVSKELSRLLTNQDRGMIDFLTDIWDGESIDYQTKYGNVKIKRPSLNLIGATTPTSLAGSLPRGASDHGILSRIIFVYAAAQYQNLARPKSPGAREHELQERIVGRFNRITEYEGAFRESVEAAELYDSLYEYKPHISDSRFNGYAGRRAIHLRKLMVALAAARNDSSQKIIKTDVMLAHDLLVATEDSMGQALFALGSSQLHLGKYLMLEYMRSEGTASLDDLYRVAQSELRRADIKMAIEELCSTGIIAPISGNLYALTEVTRQTKGRSSSQSGEQAPGTPESS